LFMGEFLGVNDDWAREGYTAHSRAEVEAFLTAFEPLHFEEVERDGFTIRGTPKHWHAFHVIARKKA
jgi:tellurite methyltransferase